MKRLILLCLITAIRVTSAAEIKISSAEKFISGPEKNRITVVVFSINDFHSAVVPDGEKGIAGAACLVSTLDSLKRVYPYHVTVSAGDNFGGSYFYQATRGALMPQLLRDMDIRVSAIGNHEFDEGQERLAAKWNDVELRPRSWDLTYVCANVRYANGEIPAFAQPFQVVDVPYSDTGKVSVAFVGLITSSTPQQASRRRLAGLHFDGNYARVLDSLARTPAYEAVRQADVRVLLTHIGTGMQDGHPVWQDPDAESLSRIDSPDWHGILTSHMHNAVCGRINRRNYPVVQGLWHGHYISLLKVEVDTLTRQVTAVEPELVEVKPGQPASPRARRLQAQVDELLSTCTVQGGMPLGEQLTQAVADLPHDRTHKYVLSEVGDLVCTAYAEAYRRATGCPPAEVVVGASHIGSIRAGIGRGGVSVLDVGETLPFANNLRTYRLTGRQLQELVEYGLHNVSYGWLQTSGLEIVCDDARSLHVRQLYYLQPDGQRRRIGPKDQCILVVDDYITTGGDGYLPEQFPDSQAVDIQLPVTTAAFIDYLKRQPTIGGHPELVRRLRVGKDAPVSTVAPTVEP